MTEEQRTESECLLSWAWTWCDHPQSGTEAWTGHLRWRVWSKYTLNMFSFIFNSLLTHFDLLVTTLLFAVEWFQFTLQWSQKTNGTSVCFRLVAFWSNSAWISDSSFVFSSRYWLYSPIWNCILLRSRNTVLNLMDCVQTYLEHWIFFSCVKSGNLRLKW